MFHFFFARRIPTNSLFMWPPVLPRISAMSFGLSPKLSRSSICSFKENFLSCEACSRSERAILLLNVFLLIRVVLFPLFRIGHDFIRCGSIRVWEARKYNDLLVVWCYPPLLNDVKRHGSAKPRPERLKRKPRRVCGTKSVVYCSAGKHRDQDLRLQKRTRGRNANGWWYWFFQGRQKN